MNDRPIAVCLDFGSTNSLVSLAYEDRIEIVDLAKYAKDETDHPEYMPSVVGVNLDVLMASERRLVIDRAGLDAVREYSVPISDLHCVRCHLWDRAECEGQPPDEEDPAKKTGCPPIRLIHGMKQSLCWTVPTNVYGSAWDVEEFARVLIQHLLLAAGRALGTPELPISRDVPIVVGYPVVFPGCEQDPSAGSRALERMVKACSVAAGLPIEAIHPKLEPDAALYAERARGIASAAPGATLALDFGGGTFDASISLSSASPFLPDEHAGEPVGGDRFDSLIFEHVVAPLLGVTGAIAHDNSRMKMLRTAADRSSRGRSVAGANGAWQALLDSGRVYQLWEAIEEVKLKLSEEDTADFRYVLQLPSGPQVLSATVTRTDFERWIAADLDRVFRAIDEVLDKAGVSDSEVSTVLLTGGSSRVPAFRRHVHERFSNASIEDREAFTTIVRGLAQWAREELAGLGPLEQQDDVIGKARRVNDQLKQISEADERQDGKLFGDEQTHMPGEEHPAEPEEPMSEDESPLPPKDLPRMVEFGYAADEQRWLDALAREVPPSRILEDNPDLSYSSLYSAARAAIEPRPGGATVETPSRKGLAWSRDEQGVVAWLYRNEAGVDDIALAIGRSRKAVIFQLVQMKLLPESALEEE